MASGRGPDGAPLGTAALADGLGALAALGADVVALQEVDAGQARSGGLHQTRLAAEAVGAVDWRFAPAVAGTPGPVRTWREAGGRLLGPDDAVAEPLFGVALLSTRPVRSWHVLALRRGHGRLPLRAPDPRTGRLRWWTFPDEPRVVVAAVLDDGLDAGLDDSPDGVPDGVCAVACTHLSFWPPTAVRQLRAARRWLLGLPAGEGARVLAGDVNLPGGVPARLAGAVDLVRAGTFPGTDPRMQLDHLLHFPRAGAGVSADGPDVPAGGRAVLLPVGDHRALVADVP